MGPPKLHELVVKLKNMLLLVVVVGSSRRTRTVTQRGREEPVAGNIILEMINVAKEPVHLVAALGMWVVSTEVGQPG